MVNVGRISEYAAAGRFGSEPGSEPLTVNGEVLAADGLITHADRPVKVLGDGDLEVKVFVAADAFTASAKSKIEDAGGFVQVLAPEPVAEEADAPAEEAAEEAETTTEAPAEEAPAAEAPATEAPAEEAPAGDAAKADSTDEQAAE